MYPEAWKSTKKAKITPEEKHHMYISEAELQMHETRIPLWARHELYFQSMVLEGVKMDGETAIGGDIEIERIPTHMIEARSKNLVPVFDYLQIPVFQPTRFSCGSYSNSHDTMTDGGPGITEHHSGSEEVGSIVPLMTIGSESSINNNDSLETKTQLNTVNSKGHIFKMDVQLKLVDNDIEEDMGMGNLFNQGDDNYD